MKSILYNIADITKLILAAIFALLLAIISGIVMTVLMYFSMLGELIDTYRINKLFKTNGVTK